MLVLTRHPKEEILFPKLGIRIRMLGVKGLSIRVGIEAPEEIKVFRGEISSPEVDTASAPVETLSHALRNRLNKVTLGLHFFQQQWRAGHIAAANTTFQGVLAVLETLEQEWPQETSTQSATPTRTSRPCRTLLVEDDDNERELLAGILAMSGCTCDTATDGQDALDYLSSHEAPDLVLLDMGLPRISGPQTLEHIRLHPRCQSVKVFAISGSTPADLGISVGTGGVDAWFHKPLKPQQLREAIRRGLESSIRMN